MWKLALVPIAYLCSVIIVINAQVQFHVIRQWKYINYTWTTPEIYKEATTNGLYVPENIIVAGINYYDNNFYVTMPRMKIGVPVTLGKITALPGFGTGPLIAPFPSWDYNKINDCNALQNVQNLEIDPKGIMYILDGGHTHSLMQEPVKNCPAQLVLYDLNKNATVLTYVFPDHVANRNGSFLYDLVVDGEFVYITDNSASDPGIVVYSKSDNRSWKIRHSKTMRADPSAQNFKVNDHVISAPINVAGIALGPKSQRSSEGEGIVLNQDREVFYSPMSSLHLYSISTAILQNEANTNNGQDYPGDVRDVGLKASQTDGIIMTNRGVMYFGLLGDNSIAQWNSSLPFASGQKILSRDVNYIQWTNAFTIDTNGTLIVLSNTLQTFIHGDLDTHRYNFWLLSANIGEKSYLYDDPTFEYSPVPPSTTNQMQSSTTAKPVPTKPDSINEIDGDIKAEEKGSANLQNLEISVLLISVLAWVFYHN